LISANDKAIALAYCSSSSISFSNAMDALFSGEPTTFLETLLLGKYKLLF